MNWQQLIGAHTFLDNIEKRNKAYGGGSTSANVGNPDTKTGQQTQGHQDHPHPEKNGTAAQQG